MTHTAHPIHQLDADQEALFKSLLAEAKSYGTSSLKEYWAGSASESVLNDYRNGKARNV